MQTPALTGRRPSYGWVIVTVSFILLVGSFGTQLCFGLFLKPLAEEFGWSRAAVSGGMSLLMAVSGLAGIFMGKATDKWGARAAIAPGLVLGAIGYLLLSRMNHLWEFYVCFGIGGGLLAGCSYTPAVTIVSDWFGPRQRTLAIGIALLGVIAGQMILSPVISGVIEADGWRTGWWVLAIVGFVCGLPALALARKNPDGEAALAAERHQAGGAGPGGLTAAESAHTLAFWILMASGAAIGMGFYAFNAHIVSYATDVGLTAEKAALIFTVSSVGGALGSVLAGATTHRLGHRWSLLLFTALNAVAMFLFIPAASAWVFYLFGAVLGFAFSGAVPVRMAVVPPLFGTRAVGAIIGLASASFSMGAIAGPFLAGYIFDSTGSYDLAFMIFGILLVLGAAWLYFLKAPKGAPGYHQSAEAADGTPAAAGGPAAD